MRPDGYSIRFKEDCVTISDPTGFKKYPFIERSEIPDILESAGLMEAAETFRKTPDVLPPRF
jgi:hypothetical protein